MRNGIVYSRERRIRVGTSAYGRFLCTAVNVVGSALSASLAVEIKGGCGMAKWSVCLPMHRMVIHGFESLPDTLWVPSLSYCTV